MLTYCTGSVTCEVMCQGKTEEPSFNSILYKMEDPTEKMPAEEHATSTQIIRCLKRGSEFSENL